MAQNARARSGNDRDDDQPSMQALEVVRLAPKYITAITDHQPTQMTSLAPTDEGGWLAEVEVVEDRRIPSSADILALYEIELDAEGELLAYRRTRRYMRGQALSPLQDPEQTVVNGDLNGDLKSDWPQ